MLADLLRYLKGLFHGATCRNEMCDCRIEKGVAIGGADSVEPNYDYYSSAPEILQRFPKYPLGAKLKRGGAVGVVGIIYADYKIATSGFGIDLEYLRENPPSSEDQVFYGVVVLVRWKGRVVATGMVLVGENDVELASDGDIEEKFKEIAS